MMRKSEPLSTRLFPSAYLSARDEGEIRDVRIGDVVGGRIRFAVEGIRRL